MIRPIWRDGRCFVDVAPGKVEAYIEALEELADLYESGLDAVCEDEEEGTSWIDPVDVNRIETRIRTRC